MGTTASSMIPGPTERVEASTARSDTLRNVTFLPTSTQLLHDIRTPPHLALWEIHMELAVTLQALAIDKRLLCGVAESPFATLREVIHDYFRQMFFVPLNAIPDAALKHSEEIAHFAVDSVRPVDDARTILQPTMIVHGETDTRSRLSTEDGYSLNLASPNKELYLIPEAGHNDLADVGGSEYQGRILAFFNRYLVRPGPPT